MLEEGYYMYLYTEVSFVLGLCIGVVVGFVTCVLLLLNTNRISNYRNRIISGYQPDCTADPLDESNPPQGGSGLVHRK
jgi:hypothetical protein